MLQPSQIRSIRDFFGQCTVGFGNHFTPRVDRRTIEQWEAGTLPIPDAHAKTIIERAALTRTASYDLIEQGQQLCRESGSPKPLICVGFLFDEPFKTYDFDNYQKFLGSHYLYNVAAHNAVTFSRKHPRVCKVISYIFSEKRYLNWLQKGGKNHHPGLLPIWAREELAAEKQQRAMALRRKKPNQSVQALFAKHGKNPVPIEELLGAMGISYRSPVSS